MNDELLCLFFVWGGYVFFMVYGFGGWRGDRFFYRLVYGLLLLLLLQQLPCYVMYYYPWGWRTLFCGHFVCAPGEGGHCPPPGLCVCTW